MKIFVWGNNSSLGNKQQSIPFSNQVPFFYTKPDSALLKDGKPFFLPDFLSGVCASVEYVIRLNRLGKSIPARFASRYYAEATAGVNLFAKGDVERLAAAGLPWDEATGFDGSAVVGKFVPVGSEQRNWAVELKINGHLVQTGNTSDLVMGIDEGISFLSRYHTLKTGDLVYTGFLGESPAVLGIGDHLEGYLDGVKLLDFHIR